MRLYCLILVYRMIIVEPVLCAEESQTFPNEIKLLGNCQDYKILNAGACVILKVNDQGKVPVTDSIC